jgi:hypothetical protein
MAVAAAATMAVAAAATMAIAAAATRARDGKLLDRAGLAINKGIGGLLGRAS